MARLTPVLRAFSQALTIPLRWQRPQKVRKGWEAALHPTWRRMAVIGGTRTVGFGAAEHLSRPIYSGNDRAGGAPGRSQACLSSVSDTP